MLSLVSFYQNSVYHKLFFRCFSNRNYMFQRYRGKVKGSFRTFHKNNKIFIGCLPSSQFIAGSPSYSTEHESLNLGVNGQLVS